MRTVKFTAKGRMAMTQRKKALEEAALALGEMREALARAGITLPSLRLDTASYADVNPRPLVELGRCNVETARKITHALRSEAGE
jgi:hypothetical protein